MEFEKEVFSSVPGDKNDKDLLYALYDAQKIAENAIETWGLKYDEDFQRKIKIQKQEILDLFPGLIFCEEIPNEYAPSIPYFAAQPWFLITTTIGIFKIGWRKSVIELDWERTNCKKTARELFPDENVTKGEYSIHAWGIEYAKKYIKNIFENV